MPKSGQPLNFPPQLLLPPGEKPFKIVTPERGVRLSGEEVRVEELPELLGPEGRAELAQVVRGRPRLQRLIGGAIDERAVQHTISESRVHPLSVQIGTREDVVAIDTGFGDQVGREFGPAV
jgi:hypothetical protein